MEDYALGNGVLHSTEAVFFQLAIISL